MIVKRYPNLKTRLAVQSSAVKSSLYLTEKLPRWLIALLCVKKNKNKRKLFLLLENITTPVKRRRRTEFNLQ